MRTSYPRHRPARRAAPRFSAHFGKLEAKLASQRHKNTGALLALWPQIMGETLARATFPGRITTRSGERLLYIHARSGAALMECRMRSADIIGAINARMGETRIDTLRIRYSAQRL